MDRLTFSCSSIALDKDLKTFAALHWQVGLGLPVHWVDASIRWTLCRLPEDSANGTGSGLFRATGVIGLESPRKSRNGLSFSSSTGVDSDATYLVSDPKPADGHNGWKEFSAATSDDIIWALVDCALKVVCRHGAGPSATPCS